jgi:hypothetical protein
MLYWPCGSINSATDMPAISVDVPEPAPRHDHHALARPAGIEVAGLDQLVGDQPLHEAATVAEVRVGVAFRQKRSRVERSIGIA